MSEWEGRSSFAEAEMPTAPPKSSASAAEAPPSAPSAPAATSTTPVTVEIAAAEMSLPESVVSPLMGAGANVFILTNELTQTVREKLGVSWPFVQETFNSRCARLVAGGLLSSLAAIVFYKILKRLSQGKPPGSADVQWGSKTYEMTPLGEKGAVLRPEGDAGAIHMLPHKIQLRIAENPQNAISHSADPEALLCKARDGPPATTRNRHTRRREPGEPPRGDPPPPDNPWHTERHQRLHRRSPGPEEDEHQHPDQHHHQSGEPECHCPSELCCCSGGGGAGGGGGGSVHPDDEDDQPAGRSQPPPPPPLQPRLLYSVRESRVVQRAMDMADPRMVNMLTYSSCPAALCRYPALVAAGASPSSGPAGLYYHPHPGGPTGSPQFVGCAAAGGAGVGGGAGAYVPEMLGHPGCPLHAAQAAAFLLQQPNPATGAGGPWAESRDDGHNRSAAMGASAAELRDVVQNHQRVVSVHPARAAAANNQANAASCYATGGGGGAAPALRSDYSAASFPAVSAFPPHPHFHPHQPQEAVVFHTTPHGAVVCGPAAYSDQQQQQQQQHLQFRNMSYHHHHHHSAGAGSQGSQPQQPMVRAQQQQQQQQQPHHHQQQPVVQQPSDSNLSQVSSTVCTESQDGKQQSDGGLSGRISAQPDVVPRERLPVLRQQSEARTQQSARNPACSVPLSAAHHAPLAIADYAHNEFPWRGPSAQQGYQPSPVYMLGMHHPDSYHHPQHHLRNNQPAAWLAGPKGFLMPVPAAHQGMMYAPSPAAAAAAAGVYGSSFSPPGLYPSPHADLYAPASFAHHHHHHGGGFYPPYYAASPTVPSHAMLGSQQFHNPFFYPVPPDLAKPMGYYPNFNLSNSNPHVFKQQQQQQPGGGEGREASGNGNGNKICVVEPDNSVSTNSDNHKPDIAGGGDKAAVDLKESTLAALEDLSAKLESCVVSTPSEDSPEASHPTLPREDSAPASLEDSGELFFAFHQKPAAPPKVDSPPFRHPVAEMFNPEHQPATDMPHIEVFDAASEPNDDIVAFPTLTDAASAASDLTDLFSLPEGANASKNNEVFLSCIGQEAVEIVDAIDYTTYDSTSSHALHPQHDGMETQL